MPSAYVRMSRRPAGVTRSAYVRGSPLALKSYGAPAASTSCTRGRLVSLFSWRRLAVSNDWMNTLDRGVSSRCFFSVLTEPPLERKADALEVGRVLGLGIDPDRPVQLLALPGDQVEHLVQRGHLEPPVVAGVLRPDSRHPLLGAQGLELGEGEVLGEPAGDGDAVDGLGGAARGELGVVGDVGRRADLVLVPGDQHAVLGGDQVRLDVVGAHPDRQVVGGQGVLRAVARRTPVADDQRLLLLRAGGRSGGSRRRGAGGERRDRERGGDQPRGLPEKCHARNQAARGDREDSPR